MTQKANNWSEKCIQMLSQFVHQRNWREIHTYLDQHAYEMTYDALTYLMDCILTVDPKRMDYYVCPVLQQVQAHALFDSVMLSKQLASEYAYWRYHAFLHCKVSVDQCLVGMMDNHNPVRQVASNKMKGLYPDWSEE